MAWYTNLYKSNAELEFEVQNWKQEHLQMKTGQHKLKLYLRCICLAVLVFQSICSMYFRGIVRGIILMIVSVTGLGKTFIQINLFLSIRCSLNPNASKSVLALNHLCFEFAFTINIIVVLVYWSLLHSKTMQE